ncbi:MAG: nicotinamide-nucleotide amidohydrolase family protein [Casimicrobiaceae bacterium]|nr:nicotinamide-nucleotide amidohydrolase family protein [Casimicrobiaceae bacterium]MCX8099171.1 nicotinamide-nucleotide amidohydrolase family protein [Casimicrobiaceae bacterium]MDW8312610.1 nicotinamide-nucleotide amidohydrolase family protein [Burkholderiales bacterium]
MVNEPLSALAHRLGECCLARGIVLAGAESCTGGWIATAITTVAGSSQWFDRAYVTYSNAAKVESLGVSAHTLETFGAVSEETAREMALGVLARASAHLTYAVTGIAGPTGGSAVKPVGLVCFAFAARGFGAASRQTRLESFQRHFTGDRTGVRAQAVAFALERLLVLAEQSSA